MGTKLRMAKKVTDRFSFFYFSFLRLCLSNTILSLSFEAALFASKRTEFFLSCVLYGTLESSKNDGKRDKISDLLVH